MSPHSVRYLEYVSRSDGVACGNECVSIFAACSADTVSCARLVHAPGKSWINQFFGKTKKTNTTDR